MTVVENFERMASHMVTGMMTHEQLMNAYLFIGLKGYAACHEYHYLSETKGYIALCKYAADHLNTIISAAQPLQDIPDIIPKSWYQNTRDKVDFNTRLQAIKEGLNEWIEWEESTKSLYEEVYSLIMPVDIPASEFVKQYILDVEEEIVYARNELLSKRSMEFDMPTIVKEQEELVHFFNKKINKQ